MTATLTGTDDALVVALAGGASYRDAAKAAGSSERTIRRRMKSPEFRQRLAEFRSESFEQATARFAHSLTAAQTRLDQLVQDPNPMVALGAVRATFEYALRFRDQTDLAAEVQKIREDLDEQGAA